MKKVIVVMLMLVGFATFAQEEKQAGKRAEMEKMTPEQILEFEIGTAVPRLYELDENIIESRKYFGFTIDDCNIVLKMS